MNTYECMNCLPWKSIIFVPVNNLKFKWRKLRSVCCMESFFKLHKSLRKSEHSEATTLSGLNWIVNILLAHQGGCQKNSKGRLKLEEALSTTFVFVVPILSLCLSSSCLCQILIRIAPRQEKTAFLTSFVPSWLFITVARKLRQNNDQNNCRGVITS